MSSNQPKASSLFSLLLICILHLVTEVTSKSYYHSDLVLDFLCESRSIPIFVRDVPWDCTSYVVCVQGQAIHTQCPATKLFSWTGQVSKCMPSAEVDTSRCKGQICGKYPLLKSSLSNLSRMFIIKDETNVHEIKIIHFQFHGMPLYL